MAIRIPKPSGASESVGGKTIRIPRDRGKQIVNLPSTNLLSSVPNAIAPAFDQLTAFLDVTAARVKAHNDKIEAQRIKNKNTLNTANFTSDVNQILEDIKNYIMVMMTHMPNGFLTKCKKLVKAKLKCGHYEMIKF